MAPFKRPKLALISRSVPRMYVWHRCTPAGERLGLNTDEFVVVEEESGGLVTTPKPQAGIVLDGSPKCQKAIRRRLAGFDPRRHCIAAIVRPDSFEGFHVLKEVLGATGFEYALWPMSADGAIRDRGGSSRPVQ